MEFSGKEILGFFRKIPWFPRKINWSKDQFDRFLCASFSKNAKNGPFFQGQEKGHFLAFLLKDAQRNRSNWSFDQFWSWVFPGQNDLFWSNFGQIWPKLGVKRYFWPKMILLPGKMSLFQKGHFTYQGKASKMPFWKGVLEGRHLTFWRLGPFGQIKGSKRFRGNRGKRGMTDPYLNLEILIFRKIGIFSKEKWSFPGKTGRSSDKIPRFTLGRGVDFRKMEKIGRKNKINFIFLKFSTKICQFFPFSGNLHPGPR